MACCHKDRNRKPCGLSANNSVHRDRDRFFYHEFEPEIEEPNEARELLNALDAEVPQAVENALRFLLEQFT